MSRMIVMSYDETYEMNVALNGLDSAPGCPESFSQLILASARSRFSFLYDDTG